MYPIAARIHCAINSKTLLSRVAESCIRDFRPKFIPVDLRHIINIAA